jgi:predicted SAM-dependent methyltransferase
MTDKQGEGDSGTAGTIDRPNRAGTSVVAPKLLHLGCGTVTPVEWTNVDGSFNAWLTQHRFLRKLVGLVHLVPRDSMETQWPKNIVVADLRKRLNFPDNSFDAVYSSHTIEHLFHNQALDVLKEARRVLKPGGHCRTMVPDLGAIIRDYVEQMRLLHAGTPAPPPGDDPGRHLIGRLLMREESRKRSGILIGLYRNLTDFHAHKWMYDNNSLTKLMIEAGFVNCRQRSYLDSEIPHIEKVELENRAVDAAIVEGMKEV